MEHVGTPKALPQNILVKTFLPRPGHSHPSPLNTQRRHTTLTQYASSSTGEFQANFSLLGLSYHHGWAQKFVRIRLEQ